jgi:hypothetical protein
MQSFLCYPDFSCTELKEENCSLPSYPGTKLKVFSIGKFLRTQSTVCVCVCVCVCLCPRDF